MKHGFQEAIPLFWFSAILTILQNDSTTDASLSSQLKLLNKIISCCALQAANYGANIF